MNAGSSGRRSLAVSRSWHPFSTGPIEPSGFTRRHRLGRDGYPFRKRNSRLSRSTGGTLSSPSGPQILRMTFAEPLPPHRYSWQGTAMLN